MMTFDEAWEAYKGIQYGFTRPEAAVLHELASEAEDGIIVEVGSMQGGSACIMESVGRFIACIDPIENPDYHAMFMKNTRGKSISLIRNKDLAIWDRWDFPVGLLHIDHDHSYRSTLDSLNNWKRYLIQDAVVAIHDYGDPHWTEVKPAVDDSGLKILGVVGRLAWGKW